MGLAEVERKVLELPLEERLQFADWFYQNAPLFASPGLGEQGQVGGPITAEVMAELVRRRDQLDLETVKTFELQEMSALAQTGLDEIYRSRH